MKGRTCETCCWWKARKNEARNADASGRLRRDATGDCCRYPPVIDWTFRDLQAREAENDETGERCAEDLLLEDLSACECRRPCTERDDFCGEWQAKPENEDHWPERWPEVTQDE